MTKLIPPTKAQLPSHWSLDTKHNESHCFNFCFPFLLYFNWKVDPWSVSMDTDSGIPGMRAKWGGRGNLFNVAIWHTKSVLFWLDTLFKWRKPSFYHVESTNMKVFRDLGIFLISDFSNNHSRKQIYICWIWDILRWIYTWGTSLLYI